MDPKGQKNINGMVTVVEALIFEDQVRADFFKDASGTLKELGVEIKDKKTANKVANELKRFIEEDYALLAERSGVDPNGPGSVSVVGTMAATAVATGVVSGVHSWTTSDRESLDDFIFDDITLDFSRINTMARVRASETRIIELEKKLRDERMIPQRNRGDIDPLSWRR